MMKQVEFKSISKVFLVIIVLFFLTGHVFALVYGNESDKGFDGGSGGGKSSTPIIRTYVIRGAGYFLSAHSDILLFLDKTELAELDGVDYTELQGIITNALQHMQQAGDTYFNLTQTADITPYNMEVIDQLVQFDYAAFQQEKGLNAVIFADAAAYLSKGDIRGIYHRFLSVCENLLVQLNAIKADIDARRFPQAQDLWNLNQYTGKSLLFGQYTAQVFHQVTAGGEKDDASI